MRFILTISISVDNYIKKHSEWAIELEKLRNLCLECGLSETIKWGAPVYMWKKQNVVEIGAFKSYVGLWFFQGALLTDPYNMLINAQEGKTRALRQIRFTSRDEIDIELLKNYVIEARTLAESGKRIKAKRTKPIEIPKILVNEMKQNSQFKAAFLALSKGKQREYSEYIAEAKK